MRPELSLFNTLGYFIEPELRDNILEHGELVSASKGDVIVREGQYVKVLPIVISGSIRVFQRREDREILLYYVNAAQTCMMSLSACFFNDRSPSQAVAMEPTEILTIPTRFITAWQKEFNSWNSFVIKTFRNRYDELLNTFESVAFNHVDRRIKEYLDNRSTLEETKTIQISHQKLANELGTTRVVVSRIIKQFEQDGIVRIRRGAIELM